MKIEISTMLDDELEPHRQQALLTALHDDAELRGTMTSYLLIGDALRGGDDLAQDLTPGVMARLEAEPTVLAPPRRRRSSDLLRNTAALAASLTGVAVVVWLAFVPPAPQGPPTLAKAATPELVATSERMQEYLMAHQAYAPSSRIQGGASYIRTISAAR